MIVFKFFPAPGFCLFLLRQIKRKMVRLFNEFLVVLMVLSLGSQSGSTMSIAGGTIPKEVAAARFFRSLQRRMFTRILFFIKFLTKAEQTQVGMQYISH